MKTCFDYYSHKYEKCVWYRLGKCFHSKAPVSGSSCIKDKCSVFEDSCMFDEKQRNKSSRNSPGEINKKGDSLFGK